MMKVPSKRELKEKERIEKYLRAGGSLVLTITGNIEEYSAGGRPLTPTQARYWIEALGLRGQRDGLFPESRPQSWRVAKIEPVA